MTRIWLFTIFVMGLCVGFAIGIESQPQLTRYTFTYGHAPSTAHLLGGK